ncbi:hypothetical protein [Streptomyces sp. TRM68367]|uniref:hypothetical protein n=1 Tax=Streptomyces sp. TRM68367 TaxID=2758415 RepID=UPI00165B6602|nr:hypothetical protein [Streptomyces sp. TRM68367]MBC9730241.1 hypothetical protein [Streptomyces sp. TRM68367]
MTGTAVLYVCVERSHRLRESGRSDAEARAREEGHAYAAAHDLSIVAEFGDLYGAEPDPGRRLGWCAMRAFLAAGDVSTVITRWPCSVAPESHHEQRFAALRELQDREISIGWSWERAAAEQEAHRGI